MDEDVPSNAALLEHFNVQQAESDEDSGYDGFISEESPLETKLDRVRAGRATI